VSEVFGGKGVPQNLSVEFTKKTGNGYSGDGRWSRMTREEADFSKKPRLRRRGDKIQDRIFHFHLERPRGLTDNSSHFRRGEGGAQ